MSNEQVARDRALELALKATGPTQLGEKFDADIIQRADAFARFLRGMNKDSGGETQDGKMSPI
jgi:hypothetical protein